MKPDDDRLLDRKTKRKLEDKMFKKNQIHSLKTAYRKKRRVEYAIKKEEELLNEHKKYVEGLQEKDPDANDKSPIFSISIAVPGSLLNNAQSAELRTYMAGQIARTATLFNVEDIIIYDETAKMRQEDIDGYYSGSWYGDIIPSDKNFESCFYLAKILEYVECPQYLRKQLFPKQRSLKFAGLLNPLDAHHHLKSDDLSIPYREGVVLNKPPKDGHGLYCDIGLEKEFQLEEQVDLPANTRVTVKINNLNDAKRKFRGSLTSPKEVRKATGLYWGYSVNFATSLKDIIADGKYDYVLGTSPRGKSVNDLMISTLQRIRVLVVFGGVQGVDVVFEREENWEYKTAEEAFTDLINCLPNKGSSTERVEESIMVTLSELSLRLQQLS